MHITCNKRGAKWCNSLLREFFFPVTSLFSTYVHILAFFFEYLEDFSRVSHSDKLLSGRCLLPRARHEYLWFHVTRCWNHTKLFNNHCWWFTFCIVFLNLTKFLFYFNISVIVSLVFSVTNASIATDTAHYYSCHAGPCIRFLNRIMHAFWKILTLSIAFTFDAY